jgi:uncharacterized LabA/DUF88 family protein
MNIERVNIYIDGNNLYRGAKRLNFEIDYKKFRGWLRQKYNVKNVFLFIGLINTNLNFYSYLQECGFILIFKPVSKVHGQINGNCDAELVLRVVSDFYRKEYEKCILITGDGDFGCLVEFLNDNKSFKLLISPNSTECSYLLRNKNIEISFLNEHYHKFKKEKAPDADVSA